VDLWVLPFEPAAAGAVRIRTAGTSESVIADAVKWVRTAIWPPPRLNPAKGPSLKGLSITLDPGGDVIL